MQRPRPYSTKASPEKRPQTAKRKRHAASQEVSPLKDFNQPVIVSKEKVVFSGAPTHFEPKRKKIKFIRPNTGHFTKEDLKQTVGNETARVNVKKAFWQRNDHFGKKMRTLREGEMMTAKMKGRVKRNEVEKHLFKKDHKG